MPPKGANLEPTDLLEISEVSGTGYITKSITGQEIIDAAGGGTGTVTSVDLTMPSAFTVTGNPITTAGTLAVAGAGVATQYIRGDGQLANFPTDIQSIPIVVNTNTTATNDSVYHVIANATFTDPTPVEGRGYVVIVRSGTATIGGSVYPTTRIIYRIYQGGGWQNYEYRDANSNANTFVPQTRTINGLDLSANRTLTTADIADSTNKRYVTDANLTVLGNTSGTNTGDQNLSGLVPYTGATANVDLGTFHLDAAKGTFNHNGSTDTLTANHASGSGIGLLITKGGNNEGLKVNKTSGSGNAATIIGTLEATTIVKTGGTATEFLMADGTVSTFMNPRVQSVGSSATVTPTSTNDIVTITAQAVGLTLANPTGTFSEGQSLIIRIKDNGTARSIAYGTNFRAIGVTLPTTTVLSKTTYLGIIYNDTDTKWDVVGVTTQA
jgi:hypothetical protein